MTTNMANFTFSAWTVVFAHEFDFSPLTRHFNHILFMRQKSAESSFTLVKSKSYLHRLSIILAPAVSVSGGGGQCCTTCAFCRCRQVAK